MENNKYEKLERIFIEYIINLVGPNYENDIYRSEKLKLMISIIKNCFSTEKNIIPHIFLFGSFPMKTYLPDSDMDITIILEDKQTNTIITKYSHEFLNNILFSLQSALENYVDESEYPIISEVSIIMADVKLIKCKFENLAFDISINNFVGLCKLILINRFEKELQNPELFKRSLFLIKSWCYYEGSLLGSNLGLLASYGLEIIVMYIFNKYNHLIKTEIDALCLFFEKTHEFKWERDIMSILGRISLDAFHEEYKINNSPLESLQKNLTENETNEVFHYENLQELTNFFEKFADLDRIQNFNSNKKIFNVKYLNIIDPMFNNNNLGKSVNLHSFNKFLKVIEYEIKDISKLKEMRQLNNRYFTPEKYLNQLLKIFEKTITYNNPDLFYMSLPQPKIFIHSFTNLSNNLNIFESMFNNKDQKASPKDFRLEYDNNEANDNNSNTYKEKNHNENKVNEFETKLEKFSRLFLDAEKNNEEKDYNYTRQNYEMVNSYNKSAHFNSIENQNKLKNKDYNINNDEELCGDSNHENTNTQKNNFSYMTDLNNIDSRNQSLSNNNSYIKSNNESSSNTIIANQQKIHNPSTRNMKDLENQVQNEIQQNQYTNYNYPKNNINVLNNYVWPNKVEISNDTEISNILKTFSIDWNKNLITKEVLDFITNNFQKSNPYKFSTMIEISKIEKFLNDCKFES